ncbi:exported hypothetical protein [Mesorhizobium ventifaucium]|uniref:Uncharacterized protein n=1 Tax=Mesorhizobium ventifaucium TaxID=666020 RepID=A0ABM9E297_9HYPH|nr:exported hypothetical protein [Mesorhizobium ventifaucium]
MVPKVTFSVAAALSVLAVSSTIAPAEILSFPSIHTTLSWLRRAARRLDTIDSSTINSRCKTHAITRTARLRNGGAPRPDGSY